MHPPIIHSWSYCLYADGSVHEPWFLLSAGIAGTAVGVLVAVFGKSGESSSARLARCSMGFVVSMVWIMAIADEVVEVLQVRGKVSLVDVSSSHN